MDGGLIRPGPSRSARRKIYAPMGGSDANGNSARRQGPLRSGRRRPFAERLPLPPPRLLRQRSLWAGGPRLPLSRPGQEDRARAPPPSSRSSRPPLAQNGRTEESRGG